MTIHSTERCTPRGAFELQKNNTAFLLDVRSQDEFAGKHAQGAVCIPLNTLESRLAEVPSDTLVVCICAGGQRSQMAVEKLKAAGRTNVTDILGGTNAWAKEGLPMVQNSNTLPLESQIRIMGGSFATIFTLLGVFVAPAWHWGTLGVGLMQIITGATQTCPMLPVLKLLPWNRV
jgi:rhodanese-related sulfurtransferase